MPPAAAPETVRADAPAKLNLYLHVTGRRADGYHLLDSLVVFTDLRDVITVRAADRLTLRQEGPFAAGLPDGDDNLVLRAARALATAAGVTPRAEILLEKNIPLAAGLGGGSTDAAAALVALGRLWGCGLPAGRLAEIALSLGADVPVCLHGGAAFVGGIGEDIAPAPALPALGCLLVNCGTPLSTPEVFRARQGAFSHPARFGSVPEGPAALAAILARRSNDLTAAACALAPEVSDVLKAIGADPTCLMARLSGSGATCFGLYEDSNAARAAAARLPEGRWWRHAGSITAGGQGLS